MKKTAIIFIVLAGVFMLGGCGQKQELVWLVQSPEFVEEKQDLLNEYLESQEVDYTVTLKSVLVDPSQIENIEDYDEVYLLTELDYDRYMAKIQRLEDNKEQVDILFVPPLGANMDYVDYAAKGWLEPLDDYLENNNEGTAVYDKINEIIWEALRLDGTIYGIANPYRAASNPYAYSTYYLDKYNIDIDDISPTMTDNDELFEIIREGEGEDFPVIVQWNPILTSFPIYYLTPSETVGINEEGIAVNIYEDNNVRQYLKDLHNLREKGYLHIADYDGHEVLTEENGYFGITYGIWYTEPVVSEMEIAWGEEQMTTELLIIPWTTVSQYGYYPVRSEVNGIASWSEHKDLVFSFLDLLYTDSELANLIAYGEEGTDYALEDGKIAYAYSYYRSYTNELLTYPLDDEMENKEEAHEKYYSTGAETAVKSFRFDPTPVQAEVDATNAVIYNNDPEVFSVYTKWGDALESLDTEDMPVLLDEICEQLEAAGIHKVIEEAQKQWDVFQNK